MMRAYWVARSMRICLGEEESGTKNRCEGCCYYNTAEYKELTCRKALHTEAAQLLGDMAGDIERQGGCTMCMHYDSCERDTKGTDVVLCHDFAYPECGYKKYELERRTKNGRDSG